MDALGLSHSGLVYTACYNTDMQHLDVEMGLVTNQAYPREDGDSNAQIIPAGKKISFTHKGPYKEMGHGYAVAAKWMQEQHYRPTGIAYEYYLNSIEDVSESNLLTRVEFLLQE